MNSGFSAGTVIARRAKESAPPLSFAQERLWFLDALGAGASYHVPVAFKLSGRLDLTALKEALDAIIARHEALRTVFPAPDGQPTAVVARSQTLQLPVIAVDHRDALRAASAAAAEPFDLAHGPLVRAKILRLAADEHWLVISIHHIVCDGWSMTNLFAELAELYSARLHRRAAQLPDLLVQYGDYALWQRRHLAGEAGNAARTFWRQALEGIPPPLELPGDRPRPVRPAGASATVPLHVPARLVTALMELSRDEDTTLFPTLLAGWQALLHRWTGAIDFCVGTPVAGRTLPEFEPLIGLFANTLVLRAELSGDPCFREALRQSRETVLRAHEHQDMPFEQLVAELRPERELGRTPLVSTVIALQNLGGRLPVLPGLAVSPISLPGGGAKFDLTLELAQNKDEPGLLGALEYRSDFFEHSTVTRLADQFIRLLEGAAADPDRPLSRLPLLSRQERQQILVDWNGGTSKSEVQVAPVHEMFAQRVRESPGRVAIVFGDQCMTYGELDARADRVATQLLALEIGPETRVGLCLSRSADLVVAILAVWKAGGAYVPLDPDYPAERLSFLLSDCGAKVVLTHRQLLDRLPPVETPILCLEEVPPEDVFQGKPALSRGGLARPSNAAYVIYTSGSTGTPKGVVVEHRQVAQLFTAAREQFNFDENDVWSLFHSFAFDFSVWEIWGALLHGGRLVVVPWWVSRSPEAFLELAEREGITVLNQTPSAFRQLMAVALQQRKLPPSLRTVIFGGEALDVPSLLPWFDVFGDERPELVNMYGITETTVHVTSRRLRTEDAQAGRGSVIGRPLSHLSVYVLDAHGQPVPIGVRGELYIGGAGVARGYLNRPELTAQRFPENPFGEGRIYRSGDLGRWLASGELEYLGRADNQVKIRGFRIELGEIEAALKSHKDVREAVVLAQQNPGTDPQLIAYVVMGDVMTWPELRAFLAARLPDYMLPAAMVELKSLPLTSHGKLDRDALPAPDHRATGVPFVKPETDAEQLLAEVWQEVLGIDCVGSNDNFFHLGGDSLRSIEVRARARKRGLDVPLQEIFRRQTLRGLAAVAGRSAAAPQPLAPFALIDSKGRSRLPPDAENAYPLSRLQAGLHYHSEAGADYTVYLNSLRIGCRFDLAALREAVDGMTARHAIMRTSVDFSFQEPLQVVHRRAAAPITVDDVRNLAQQDQETQISRWLDAELHHDFEWNRPPLFRFHVHVRGNDEFQLTMSDAFLDGWSVGTLLTELLAYYFARLDHKEPPELPELSFGYSDFIALERQAIANEESIRFWDEIFARADFTPLFRQPSTDGNEPHRVRRIDLPVPDDVASGLKTLANSLGVSVKHVLLAVHLKALGHLTGSITPVTGLLANGRPEVEGGERIVAPFVNLVPFCFDLSPGTFAELCRRAFAAESELLPHRRYPMADLKKRHENRDLFDTVFNFTHFHVYRRLRALSGDVLDATGNENTYFPLTVQANMNEDTGALGLAFDYKTSNFATDRMREIVAVYERVLERMARWPGQRHETASLLAVEAERRQAWVESKEDVLCLHEIFEAQARNSPHRFALTSGNDALSYGQLNARAEQIAAHLFVLGAGTEVRVGVCLERSTHLIMAILGVLKAAAAYVPLDPDYPTERLSYLLVDSGVKVVLTERKLLDRLPPTDAHVLCMEDALDRVPAAVSRPSAQPENTAYVIYTSGSTGNPKGVVVEHRQVAQLFSATEAMFQFGKDDVWTLFHSPAFDFSVWEMWGALLYGGRLVIVPYWVSRSPDLFLELCDREAVTVLNQTPSAFRQLMPVALERGGLRTVRLLISGGEALDVPGLLPWFQGRGDDRPELVNMYGITETTVHVTFRRLRRDDAQQGRGSVIGQPLPHLYVRILDAHRQAVPEGARGEIFVGGAGVARGYLSRPELTAERFVPDPFSSSAGGRLYRSGDLALRLPDGELAYLGRADEQVKVRGFRIELGEIEAALMTHPNVRAAVVTARQRHAGEVLLIGYVVLRAPQSLSELRAYLQGKLPEYMAPASLVELPALPLTNHGKVDRKALPPPAPERLDRERPFTPPGTALEESLAAIWQEVLERDRVGRDDDFFHLGGDSLSATRLIARVRHRLKVDLPLRALFEARTLSEFAERVQVAAPERARPEMSLSGEAGLAPLSFAQRRLWFLEQLGASAAYHIPIAIRFEGALDRGALLHALHEISRRHQALRTTVEMRNGEPMQVVHSPVDCSLADCDLRTEPGRLAVLLAEDARSPFDLTRGPLWRAKLFQLDQQDHVLAVTFHHIIADGWSLDVFLRELAALYTAFHQGTASPLLPLREQYGDFASWQHRHLGLDSQLAFWKRELSGLERCDLAADRPRPVLPSYRGARVPLSLDAALARELRALSHRHGTTLFMTLLAAWQALLHRSGAGDDIAVGTPIAGRQREELEPLIGFFVNTLVLRADFSADPTFAELLVQARRRTLAAYANQDAPFERVVEEIGTNRDTSRHPLFQTMLALASTPRSTAHFAGLRASFLEVEPGTCKFDVALSLAEDETSVAGMFEYSADLFDTETIERLRDRFERLLRAVTTDPERRISELPLMSAEDQEAIRRFGDGGLAVPSEPRCVHLLFQEQAKKNPGAIAIVAGSTRISYAELKSRSDRIASSLAASRIGSGARVAFRANRSAETVAAILGILSAGAAYLPIDSGWPEARVAAIVAEAGAIYIDTKTLPGGEAEHLPAEPTLDDLAYVLYTSGSSGRAKGVAVTHRNLAHSTGARPLVYRERVESFLLASPFSFDSSVAGIFWTLCEGGILVIPTDDFLEDLPALAKTLADERVTHWLSIPALYAALLRHGERYLPSFSLRTVIVAGEACPPELVAQHRALLPEVRLFNEYGPTEATVWCTAGELTGPTVHIGRPIPGTRVELVDRHLKPVGIGVPGEILIGGAGVSAGYVGQPEATAERFIVRDGARWYRSGDLGRFRPDGSLQVLGRLDDQVKVRGVRIEPAEIEAALVSYPGVSAAAVVSVEGSLVAHVCATQSSEDELRGFLAASLPAALVPRIWFFHRELPRTTSGKIDRRALLADEFPRSRAALPARDETERELLRLFQELLGVSSAGIRDGFFQFGGHSLLAVELMARIEKQFGRRLPLAAIFQGDSVAELAAKLREPALPQSSPLVLLERGGERAPFVFVHPVGGTILHYRALARRLGVERPFYALQSPALDGNPLSPGISIEALAQSYVEALRAAVPKGPYLLGGWSFGGLIAFEMARGLRHSGEDVALLALLDSHAQSDVRDDADELAALTAWELGDGQSWPEDHFAKVKGIVYAHLGAARRWTPGPYDGRAILFAAHQPGIVRDPTMGWAPLAPRLSVIEVEADHFSLLREPAVDEVAEKLRAALAGEL